MIVKPLDQGKLHEVAALHQRAFPAGEGWTENAITQMLAAPKADARGVFIADRLVGFMIVQFVAGEAEILTLATDPGDQRRGLGRFLFHKFSEDLSPLGLQTWLLDVAADNLNAIAFYAALGFKIDGRRRDYYKRLEGGRVDAILMSKAMGGQAP